ncbi:SusC/RagA family TonB-linked outer membrane protein [Niastella vici]|uniref:SusC/RagA family TonB-linked outer membrane protein n=1 Tax=Niastella vici TaxID=1703345 RepID=A0A1V9G249_9BACT|nr:TonB-dependent receptor [Niastella vici]OQP64693.1 SusC/RagA family TonB-linked outer membrane protein [Niastella vici]
MPSKLTVRLWLVILLLLPATTILAQQRSLSGKVTDSNNQPLTGATVTVKGSNVATQTNAEGSFTIIIPGTSAVLVFSSIGFEPKEMPVGNNTTLTVALKTTTSNLNEVVITGYTAQRKKDITGAVAVVEVDNMRQIPTGTPEKALQGQASGVTIVTSGAPGSNSNIRIRGITSVGSTDPLVIIDGTQGSMHDINVNDIESIQVLKDAGSAAIYGVRGSNGVVIITTKRGRTGKPRISYDAYVGTQRPLKDGFNIANTQETANAIQQSYINSGLTPGNKQFGTGTTPVIPDYITPTAAKEGDPNTDPSTYKLYDNQITKANKQGTDWFHEIFKPAVITSHNLSVSSGSDRSTFYMSVGYFDQKGTLLETFLKRYTTRINTTFNLNNKIRIGENAYFVYRQNPGFPNGNQDEGNAISFSYRESPIIPVYDIKGNFAGTGSQNLGNSENPVANLKRIHNNKGNDYQVQGNVFAEVDVLKHFTARTSFGGFVDNNAWNIFDYTQYENAENNKNPNAFTEYYMFNNSWTWTNTLTYNNVIGDHTIKVLVGTEAISNYQKGIWATRTNYPITDAGALTVDPALWTLLFGSPGGQTNGNLSVNNGVTIDNNNPATPVQSSLYSQFGRVDYNYADKYLLSATLRRDGSSVFAPDNRWGVFPSVTAGWRLTRETFMNTVSWVNDLKLRAGWGKLGSISNIRPTNAFNLFQQLAPNSFYDLNGSNNGTVPGIYASQLGNPKTTWEEDIVTNIGVDATLLNNRLSFSIEWYKKAISGLLFVPSLPATAGGAQNAFANSGDIQNTGIDMSATYNGDISDVKFGVTATFTSYHNKVKSLPAGTKYLDRVSTGSNRFGAFSRLQPGEALGAFYGYKVIGLFQSDEDVIKSPKQEAAAPGRFKYLDANGDGRISDSDRVFFGNPNPKFTAGLNLEASYKNFDFSAFFYASVGNDVINYVRYWTDFPQVFDGAVSKDAVYNSWTPTRTNAKVPRLERTANFSNTTQYNSYYLENGSFLRCKSMVFGYSMPHAMTKKFGVERLRFYIQAANLFTITKYTGLDPELTGSDLKDNTNFGIDFGNYPSNQKNYLIGVNLSF